METFAFVKITNLPAYEKVFIRNSTINEVITKLSVTLGATIRFDAVTINTINISKEWNKRKSNSIETVYEIQPDNKPRSVYAVYQLSYPIITTNSSYSIRTQCKEIIRHVAYKKPFSKNIAFSSSMFIFYACIEEEQGSSSKNYPRQFLITEPHVEPDTLQSDLTTWQCLHVENTRVKHKTAYIELNNIVKKHPYHQDNVSINAYLNSPKRKLCYHCRHDWNFRQLKDLIDCSIKVPKENSGLNKRIKELEITHSICGLWQLYFPPENQTNSHKQTKNITLLDIQSIVNIVLLLLLAILLILIIIYY